MTAAWALLALIAVGLVAAIVVGRWLEGPDRTVGGPDEQYFTAIGVQDGDEQIAVHPAEEVAVHRFRLADLRRQAVARIGRRPRP